MMNADAKAVGKILHSGDQFLVPFFQRFYSWHRANWERLREDVWALLDDPSRQQHFLGPLVCAAQHASPGDVHTFQLIDGQQRLTTLSLMLAAVRDIAAEKGDNDLAAEITETYLIHRFKKGWQQFKLVPRTGDREAFAALVRRESHEQYAALGIVEAYQFFRKSIRRETHDHPDRLRQLYETIIGRLYLVVITIGDENPYEIFESLNSTGLPLEESDLIRNFLFMQLKAEDQDDFHEHHWQPFERMFDATGDFTAVSMTAFFRDYLMRDGLFSRLSETFVDFKRSYERTKQTPTAVVAELTRFAKFYMALMRGGVGQPSEVARVLARFPLLDAATAHPLLLHLLNRLEKGQVDRPTFIGCVKDLASFVVRRTICGEQTGAYGRWFCEVIPQLGDNPQTTLRAYLLHRGWPDDESLAARLLEFPIYRRDPKKARLLLELLEESVGHKEIVDLKPLQIEHVMPQTIPSGKAGLPWREMLGDEWKKDHDRLLHTLGNLTLTGYNPNLSNRPYAEKRAELLNSKLCLNEWFDKVLTWNSETINARGQAVAKSAAQLLPRPAGDYSYQPATSNNEKKTAARLRRQAYWAGLLELLKKRQSPWLPIKPSDASAQPIHVPAYDVSFEVKIVRKNQELVIHLLFARDRGRQMFAALQKDRALLDAEFATPPVWTPGDWSEIRCTLDGASIQDQLDWLDQHEWIANRLVEFHRAFHDRLKQLNPVVTEASPHKQMLFEYWCGFHDHLRANDSLLNGVKPLPQVWNDFALGKSGCFLEALCNTTEKRIGVHLILTGGKADERFAKLEPQRKQIEQEVGTELTWHAPTDKKQRHVILRKNSVDPADRADWPNQYAWLQSHLELFHKVFQQRVRSLDSEDGDDEEDD